MICYKLVSLNYQSLVTTTNCVSYTIGAITRAPTQVGLFCFKDLKSVKRYKKNLYIIFDHQTRLLKVSCNSPILPIPETLFPGKEHLPKGTILLPWVHVIGEVIDSL